jgi:hypothetical protein
MTELERLLAACSVWVNGAQGFDAQAAAGLADWLEANNQGDCAEGVRQVCHRDFWCGVQIDVLATKGDKHDGGPEASPTGDWNITPTGAVLTLVYRLRSSPLGMELEAHLRPCPDSPDIVEIRLEQAPLLAAHERTRRCVWCHHGDLAGHKVGPSWLLPRLRAVEDHFPALKFAAICNLLRYTPMRLVAVMALAGSGLKSNSQI